MKWGMENESTAIAAYEAANNRTVKPTGLTLDIYRPYLGASHWRWTRGPVNFVRSQVPW